MASLKQSVVIECHLGSGAGCKSEVGTVSRVCMSSLHDTMEGQSSCQVSEFGAPCRCCVGQQLPALVEKAEGRMGLLVVTACLRVTFVGVPSLLRGSL